MDDREFESGTGCAAMPSEELERLLRFESLSRRELLQRGGAGAALLSLPALLAACGSGDGVKTAGSGSAARAGRDGGSVSAALASDFQSFDPLDATTVTSFMINAHVFEPLVQISAATREYAPALAAAMPAKVDDRRYTVRLRDGATFHDGSPVTPEDVAFSFRRILDPANRSIFSQFIDFIDDVKPTGENAVEFRLKFPTAFLVERLPIVKIVPQKAVKRLGRKFALSPVGSGPYSFVSAKNNAQVQLKRMPAYNGPFPGHIDNITFTIQPDASSRVASLRSGQVQVIESPLDRDIESLKSTSGLTADAVPGFAMSFLMFNCRREMFKDVRVRQALHYAIDREKIAKEIFLGNGRPAESYLPTDHPDFVRPETVYTYDPERATSLLAEAGYSKERPLKFTLLVFSDTVWIADSFPVIQQNWADVGVQVDSKGGGEDLYSLVIGRGKYDAFLALADQSLFGWDASTLISWHYQEIWAKLLYFWEGPKLDEIFGLLDRAVRTLDKDKRSALYAKLQELIAEQVPLYPVHHRLIATGWSTSKLAKFEPVRTPGLDLRSAQLAG